jgi:hypothetical protein
MSLHDRLTSIIRSRLEACEVWLTSITLPEWTRVLREVLPEVFGEDYSLPPEVEMLPDDVARTSGGNFFCSRDIGRKELLEANGQDFDGQDFKDFCHRGFRQGKAGQRILHVPTTND